VRGLRFCPLLQEPGGHLIGLVTCIGIAGTDLGEIHPPLSPKGNSLKPPR
jgi:hypothetical protein